MDDRVRARAQEAHRQVDSLYELVGGIGSGAYGAVNKARMKESPHHYVAIKSMRASDGGGISQDVYREITILHKLRHENIVRLEKVFMRPADPSAGTNTVAPEAEDKKQSKNLLSLGGEVHLVYDFAEHDLADMLRYHRSVKTVASLSVVKSVLWQLLKGIDFLHKNWIIHRDLKPANILVTGSDLPAGSGVVKIADFGLARIFQSPLRRLADDGDVVTIWYRAPELLLGSKHYTRAIDMWAVGCIFAELLTTTALFPGLEDNTKRFPEGQVKQVISVIGKPHGWRLAKECPYYDQMQAMEDHGFKLYEKIMVDCKKLGMTRPDFPRQGHGFTLLQRMLEYDPMLRITADQALTHPFFKEEPLPKSNVFADKRQIHTYPARVLKDKLAPDASTRPSKKPPPASAPIPIPVSVALSGPTVPVSAPLVAASVSVVSSPSLHGVVDKGLKRPRDNNTTV